MQNAPMMELTKAEIRWMGERANEEWKMLLSGASSAWASAKDAVADGVLRAEEGVLAADTNALLMLLAVLLVVFAVTLAAVVRLLFRRLRRRRCAPMGPSTASKGAVKRLAMVQIDETDSQGDVFEDANAMPPPSPARRAAAVTPAAVTPQVQESRFPSPAQESPLTVAKTVARATSVAGASSSSSAYKPAKQPVPTPTATRRFAQGAGTPSIFLPGAPATAAATRAATSEASLTTAQASFCKRLFERWDGTVNGHNEELQKLAAARGLSSIRVAREFHVLRRRRAAEAAAVVAAAGADASADMEEDEGGEDDEAGEDGGAAASASGRVKRPAGAAGAAAASLAKRLKSSQAGREEEAAPAAEPPFGSDDRQEDKGVGHKRAREAPPMGASSDGAGDGKKRGKAAGALEAARAQATAAAAARLELRAAAIEGHKKQQQR